MNYTLEMRCGQSVWVEYFQNLSYIFGRGALNILPDVYVCV